MAEKPTSAPSPAPDRLADIVTRAELQVNNPRFGDEFREELKQMKLTEKELTELQSRFEQSQVIDRIKNDARTIILERVKEDRQTFMKTLNPLTWKRETQINAGLAVGGVVAGGLLLSWIAKKTAAAREGAAKTASAVRNGVMYAVGGAALLAGGFLGFKLWQNWGRMEQLISSARTLNDKMLKASGEQLAAMQKQLAETQKQIAAMTGMANQKVEEMTQATTPLKQKAAEVKEEAVKAAPEVLEKAEAVTEEVSETVTQKFLGKGLTLLHPDLATQAGLDVRNVSNDVSIIEGVLNLAPVRSLRLSELAAISREDSFEKAQPQIIALLKKEGLTQDLTPAELKAVYFLALVAQAQEKNLRAAEGATREDMSIETLLDQTGGIARLLTNIKEKMQGVNLADPTDIARRMTEVHSDTESLSEDLTTSLSTQQQMEKLGLKKEDMAGFALFCAKTGSTLLSSVEQLSADENEKKYVTALAQLRAGITENGALKADIAAYMELYTHGQEEFLGPLRARLAQLNIADAVQLYLYMEKSRNGEGKLPETLNDSNPLSALLMQMKVLGMIASVDQYQGDKLKAFLTLKAGDTALNAALGGVELPDSLKKTLPIIGGIVSSVAQDKIADAKRQATAITTEVDKQYPWLKYVVGGTLAHMVGNKLLKWRSVTASRALEKSMNGWGYTLVNNPTVVEWIGLRIPVIGPIMRARANADIAERTKIFDELQTSTPRPAPTRTAPTTSDDATDDITRTAGNSDEGADVSKFRPSGTSSIPTASDTPTDLGTAPGPKPAPAGSSVIPDELDDLADAPDSATIPFRTRSAIPDDAARAGSSADDIERTASGATTDVQPRMPSGPDTIPMRPNTPDFPPADLGGPAPRLNPSPAASADVGAPDLRVVREDGTVVDALGRLTGEIADSADALRAGETAAEGFVDEAKWQNVLQNLNGDVSVADVERILREAEKEGAIILDKDTLTLIAESTSAKKLVAGAVQSGSAAEMSRVLSAAKMARNLRIGLNAVGAAGDVFGTYIAYADFVANGERIESAVATGNKELEALYRQANVVYTIEGAQSVAGLIIGTVAIVKAYVGGQSMLTALSASGGAILLPVAVAALGGGYVYRQAEGVTADWTRNAADWQRELSPGEMLEKIKATGPGQRSYWQGWGKGTITEMALRKGFSSREAFEAWESSGEKTIEDANAQMRYELTKSYLASSTVLAGKPNESKAEYRMRFDQFVIDRIRYTTLITEGMYGYQMSGYEMSNIYAELMGKSRELQKNGGSEIITWKDDTGAEESFDLKDFEDLPFNGRPGEIGQSTILRKFTQQKKQNTIMQFNLMEKLPTKMDHAEKKRAIEQQFVLASTDALMKLDGRISSADFVGLAITGTEDQGKALARYTASRMFVEELDRQAEFLIAMSKSPKGITADMYDAALDEVLSVIQQDDVLNYQRIGIERQYMEAGYVLSIAETRTLLTPGGIFKKLEKDAQWPEVEKLIRDQVAETSPEKLRTMRKEGGEFMVLLPAGATKNGNIFSYHHGGVFNKYLYAKFDGDKWVVSIGNGGQGPWKSTGELRAASSTWGFSPDTAGRYNALIQKLNDMNTQLSK